MRVNDLCLFVNWKQAGLGTKKEDQSLKICTLKIIKEHTIKFFNIKRLEYSSQIAHWITFLVYKLIIPAGNMVIS